MYVYLHARPAVPLFHSLAELLQVLHSGLFVYDHNSFAYYVVFCLFLHCSARLLLHDLLGICQVVSQRLGVSVALILFVPTLVELCALAVYVIQRCPMLGFLMLVCTAILARFYRANVEACLLISCHCVVCFLWGEKGGSGGTLPTYRTRM